MPANKDYYQALGVARGANDDEIKKAYRRLARKAGRVWREHGVHRVLVEAGPGLSGALWGNDLVDEVYWFMAPTLLGGGTPVVTGLHDARRFSDVQSHRVGWDMLYHFTTR